jgi:hypothetical protein
MGRLPTVLVLVGVVCGCHDPVTEVVVVMQSDLSIPAETESVAFSVNPGPVSPGIGSFPQGSSLFGRAFPLSIGFTSGGETPNFSITLQLLRAVNQFGVASIAVSRTVTDIRFVDQKTMMLVLPFLRACACDGTSCPSTDNPDCDSLQNPALRPFDPEVAGPGTLMAAP